MHTSGGTQRLHLLSSEIEAIHQLGPEVSALAESDRNRGPTRYRGGRLLPPGGEHVPQDANCSFTSPQGMKWALDLPASLIVSWAHFEVNVRRGPKILRRSVDRRIIRKSAEVFSHFVWPNCSRCLVKTVEHILQTKLRIESDDVFG